MILDKVRKLEKKYQDLKGLVPNIKIRLVILLLKKKISESDFSFVLKQCDILRNSFSGRRIINFSVTNRDERLTGYYMKNYNNIVEKKYDKFQTTITNPFTLNTFAFSFGVEKIPT